ncbi:MAG: hypothetical protein JWM41_4901 [Gemmatimonadetes bacterium]|nr:hypothetical protein [Gemmatimonadota bacterium]
MDIGENLLKQLAMRATAVIMLSIIASCDRTAGANQPARRGPALPDSMGAAPTHVSVVRTRARPELLENSTAAMSHRQPGVFFTINDSGNDPVLFAMDTTGADRGAWPVRGATNVDWESAAIGPCAPPGVAECVYIGDTGDNLAHHRSRAVYRVAEPAANGSTDSIVAEKLSYVYADGPHDVEAMYVARNGDMFFITKRRLKNGAGALRPALVFKLSAAEWSAHRQVVAQLVDSLSLVPGSAPLRVITDASLSPDARHLAVRTYMQVYVYATDPLTGRVLRAVPPSVCNIVSLGEPQGEGVTWADNGGRLVFTSEGQEQPIRIANCPLPRG